MQPHWEPNCVSLSHSIHSWPAPVNQKIRQMSFIRHLDNDNTKYQISRPELVTFDHLLIKLDNVHEKSLYIFSVSPQNCCLCQGGKEYKCKSPCEKPCGTSLSLPDLLYQHTAFAEERLACSHCHSKTVGNKTKTALQPLYLKFGAILAYTNQPLYFMFHSFHTKSLIEHGSNDLSSYFKWL